MTQTLALPSFEDATVVVPAPGSAPGNWSGAASAVLVDGIYWLTYRVRRPLREGRGVSVVVARSEDGEHFVTVAEVLTWSQLGLQHKPCGLLDVEGFYGPLLAFLDHTVTERFVSPEHRSLVLAEQAPGALVDLLEGWRPGAVATKWLDR